MKWIEASKQSPKEGDLYFVKIRLTGSGLETFPGTCNFYNEWQASDDYEVVEWLDESPLTNTADALIDGSLEQRAEAYCLNKGYATDGNGNKMKAAYIAGANSSQQGGDERG